MGPYEDILEAIRAAREESLRDMAEHKAKLEEERQRSVEASAKFQRDLDRLERL
jgi:Arc/MetJ-type ribon-helix-helix transcriptional regulator